MISALEFCPSGALKREPIRFELSPEEAAKLKELASEEAELDAAGSGSGDGGLGASHPFAERVASGASVLLWLCLTANGVLHAPRHPHTRHWRTLSTVAASLASSLPLVVELGSFGTLTFLVLAGMCVVLVQLSLMARSAPQLERQRTPSDQVLL